MNIFKGVDAIKFDFTSEENLVGTLGAYRTYATAPATVVSTPGNDPTNELLIDNTSAANSGKWVTAVASSGLSDGHIAALNESKAFVIKTSHTAADVNFYIKEVAFFKTKAEDDSYKTAAEAYYTYYN